MVDHFNDVVSPPPMSLTENHSATYLSTGNPCLDFFFHVVPSTRPETLELRLQEAWSYHPLTTLKLIFNLRAIRGTGKSDSEGFYTAALWLHRHHPKTLAANVPSLAKFGYFKDLPEILYRLLEGPHVRRIAKQGRISRRFNRLNNAPITKEERRIEMAKKALDRFNSDPEYRNLHDRISDLFADRLKSDLERLNSGKKRIGLSAKWCPSLYSSFDRSTLLCETIARKIFPRESSTEYADIEDAHYAYRVRDRLRKEVKVIRSLDDEDNGSVAELQWKRIVDDLAQKGTMRNCIAVCDVSGSMFGLPMDVCVALGILVSELSEEPWKGKVITFSQNPKLQIIQDEDLKSKASFVKEMDWGMNTDFQKVLDKLLKVAVSAKLKPEQMIKRVLVFSDVEFDEASAKPWETDYMVIEKKFKKKGYLVPEIVFWNLRDSIAMPVTGDQKGVALVSGFSKNMLKLFLGEGVIMTPLDVMVSAISGKAYEELVVVD